MKKGFEFPRQSVIYLLLCLSGVLIFIFIGIMPAQRKLQEIDIRASVIKMRIEEQNALADIYAALKQLSLKKGLKNNGSRALPLPAKGDLPHLQLSVLTDSIRKISKSAGLELSSLVPVLNTLNGKTGSLAIDTSVRGDFFSFRDFLTGLGGVPYLEHIEEIDIRQTSDYMELKVRFWIARS